MYWSLELHVLVGRFDVFYVEVDMESYISQVVCFGHLLGLSGKAVTLPPPSKHAPPPPPPTQPTTHDNIPPPKAMTASNPPLSKLCAHCKTVRAQILRPKTHERLCKTCFTTVFESEIHATITTHTLFQRGSRVAIGASGGKDSTVLASVLKTLNTRYDYGVEFVLLSIDEGITGYRDDSLETVKRNAVQYGMELCILGYRELYGWSMDEVVAQIGKKGNCTYCGVFRRQALDRGAARLGITHVVTGHNADDIAETVVMNREFFLFFFSFSFTPFPPLLVVIRD